MSFESSLQLRAKTHLWVCPLFARNRSLAPRPPVIRVSQTLNHWGALMRLGLVASLLCLCTVSLCLADPAKAAIRKELNVPPESLSPALQQVATTYELQVLYPTQVAKDLKTHGAVGFFTPDDALKAVLSGTGLSYKYLDANTVTIVPVAAAATATAADQTQTNTQDTSKEAGKNSSHDFRVAQVDQGTAGPQAVGNSEDQNSKKKKKGEGLEEVVVTGSRLVIPETELPLGLRTYSSEDIARSGQLTLGDYLNTLPGVSNFELSTFDIGYAGVQGVQLHGLPIGTTLTLLDGQRLPTSTLGFFDLSNLPLAAIDRVEILPVGASAIYGADALAGAVNMVLRKRFDGIEVNANVNHGVGETDAGGNLAWGRTWDRGSLLMIGNYLDQGELLGSQRSFISSTHFPGDPAALATLGADTCEPGNVYSVDGSDLPGLNSPMAAIPPGITGKPAIGQFAPTAGKQNVCNPTAFRDLVPHTEREGALLSGDYLMSSSIDLYGNIVASRRTLDSRINAQIQVSPAFGPMSATNPYNPFGVPVNVSFSYPGSGTTETQTADFVRFLFGIRGQLAASWHYELTTYFSESRFYDDELTENYTNVSNALASSNPETALNPFTTGAPGSPELMSMLTQPGVNDYITHETDRIVSGQAVLRGPIWTLPGGDVQSAVGADYYEERQDNSAYTISAPAPALELSRNAYALFGEARLPLIGSNSEGVAKETLAATLAARYDHSDDYGGAATWQLGLVWHASPRLSFQGGYATSYEAPQLLQISGPQSTVVFAPGVFDPFQGNTLIEYPVTQVLGPNPNLKPETGRSSSLGINFSSEQHAGLNASLTWYDIEIHKYIAAPSTQILVSNPGLYPGAITRSPPTPQDIQLGYLGVITQINETYYNYGDVHVAGFDSDIRYTIDGGHFGDFVPALALSNVYKWTSALLPGTPPINGVNQATFIGVGWAPRWKGTISLAWNKSPVSLNVSGRYIGPYRDYQEAFPNSDELGNTLIVDFNGRYDIARIANGQRARLKTAYISVGAVNLFNKQPPFSYNSAWYDWHEYDARGRFFYLNIGAGF